MNTDFENFKNKLDCFESSITKGLEQDSVSPERIQITATFVNVVQTFKSINLMSAISDSEKLELCEKMLPSLVSDSFSEKVKENVVKDLHNLFFARNN